MTHHSLARRKPAHKSRKPAHSLLALAALLLTLSPLPTYACTNLLVTKGASNNNSCMVSYAADSHTRYGCLAFYPGANHPAGSLLPIREWGTNRPLATIPQVPVTYNVVGNMNEHQVVIGESTWGGEERFRDPEGGLDYGSLMYLALQRSTTAREAIQCFVDLANTWGYASSGESISFADPNEVWFFECIAKAPEVVEGVNRNKGIVWVAVRIPDGYISAHANQARIRRFPLNDPENCLYAPDVISHARSLGLYTGADADFSFADTYGPADASTVRSCDARVWAFFRRFGAEDMEPYTNYALGKDLRKPLPLYVKAKAPLGIAQVAHMMRDHFEDTPLDMTQDLGAGGHSLPYRWRPMTFASEGKTYLNERAIATQQTGFWFIGQCRAGFTPKQLGGVFWFAVDDAGTSPLTPIYTCSRRISPHYALGQKASMLQYSSQSMFWLCNRIAQFAYLRYDQIGAEVLSHAQAHEAARVAELPLTDRAAALLYAKDPELAYRFLTDYSVNTAQQLFDRWQALDNYLLVKYIDGNTKSQHPDGSFLHNAWSDSIPEQIRFPGYNQAWKDNVAKTAGKRLRVPKEKK